MRRGHQLCGSFRLSYLNQWSRSYPKNPNCISLGSEPFKVDTISCSSVSGAEVLCVQADSRLASEESLSFHAARRFIIVFTKPGTSPLDSVHSLVLYLSGVTTFNIILPVCDFSRGILAEILNLFIISSVRSECPVAHFPSPLLKAYFVLLFYRKFSHISVQTPAFGEASTSHVI